MIKASKIFLDFADPLYREVPKDISADKLKHLLMIPELVWNAVVTSDDKSRKKGQLPQMLAEHIKTVPAGVQADLKKNLEMWTFRKDAYFPHHQWPLSVEVYTNLKKEVIIRVLVLEPKDKSKLAGVPGEWLREKASATVVSIKN